MSNLQWFRLYHRIIDDEKVRLIAFEDRWHFIAVCCLKADGLLDEPESSIKWRKVAVKMGIQLRELDEIKRRLFEVGLVDEDMQPTAWDDLQYRSDTSTDRVRKYREKTKTSPNETARNVSVTVQETDTEAETEEEKGKLSFSKKENSNSNSEKPSRISPDFQLSEQDRTEAISLGIPEPTIAETLAEFRDYWAAKPGKSGLSQDWPANWRRWCRKRVEDRGLAQALRPGAPPKPTSTTVTPGTAQWAAWYEFKRSTGTTRLMDAAQREGVPFPVPSDFPPSATATAA